MVEDEINEAQDRTGSKVIGEDDEEEDAVIKMRKGKHADGEEERIDEGVVSAEDRLKEEMDEGVKRELGDRLRFNRDPEEGREIGDWMRGVGKGKKREGIEEK